MNYFDERMVFCSQVLHETALIEAFNLKAGIEHQLKNCKLLWISFLYACFKCFFLTLMSYKLLVKFWILHQPSLIFILTFLTIKNCDKTFLKA